MKNETGNYQIYGRKKGSKGGVFFGFLEDSGLPCFGGSNVIYAPIWWSKTREQVQEICERITKDFPEYECQPKKVG